VGHSALKSVVAIIFLVSLAIHAAPTDTYLLFDEQSDGNADYVEIGASPDLDLTGGSFTLSAWIRPAGWGNNDQGRILDHGGGSAGAEGWSFHLENRLSSGSLRALRVQVNNDSTFFGVSDAGAVSLDIWQHVAVTLEEQSLTFYVNGVASGTQTNVPTPRSSLAPIRIGARATDFARGFDGAIDDVQIWNRALSQGEIQALLTTDLSGSEVGLISYHRLDEGSGQIVADVSGNGHAAVLGSSPGSDVNDPNWQTTVVVNQAPVVDSGADQTIVLPTDTVTLTGSVTDDDFPGNPLIVGESLRFPTFLPWIRRHRSRRPDPMYSV
jgi:hypothetical protein